MEFTRVEDFNNLEMAYISNLSRGYISKNTEIFNEIPLTKLNKFILGSAVYGTPIFKLGNGGNKILVLSGIHGNELPPQIASLSLLNSLVGRFLTDTLFFIPFASPDSTMNNWRFFNGMDLNRSAHEKNSLSNIIINKISELGIDYVGDFHSTAYNSNPGFEAVFSSKSPTMESYFMAQYISRDVGCEIIPYNSAGSSYKGAIEDVCNLRGIPSVTCEVVSPFSSVGEGSVERSLTQMESFLSYFGI